MATEVARAIEAIVMVSEEPIPPHLLAQILEVTPARVEELCQQLAESYVAEDRGFELIRVAGGYRFQSHADLAGYVERFALEGQSSRLSAAALETLALVAYKQPVSRAQVSEVRGVSVDGVMRTLQHRGYVAEVGRDPGPGQAVLYGTTARFLEKLGIDSLDHLPPLAQFVPGPEVMDALDAGLRHGGGKSSPGATPIGEREEDPDAPYAGPGPEERAISFAAVPEEGAANGRIADEQPVADAGSVAEPEPAADPELSTGDGSAEDYQEPTDGELSEMDASGPDQDYDAGLEGIVPDDRDDYPVAGDDDRGPGEPEGGAWWPLELPEEEGSGVPEP